MKTYLLLFAIILLAACNNSENTSETKTDSSEKKMNHDSMSAMNNNAVPELPPVPADAKIYFKDLKNDQTVSSPVKVEMGVGGMRVDTTGPVVANSGHFHILIDAEDSLASGVMVPKDSTHLHYGKGQTSAEVALTPGKHKLTLQFADGLHRSYGGKLATTVTINVKK
jgi:hypothetical protein